MPSWPASLPQVPNRGGYSEREDPRAVISTPVEIGPSQRRQRFSSAYRLISAVFDMSSDQLETFKTFYREDINRGATSFTWTDPVEGDTGTFVITSQNTVPIGPTDWRVSLEMERHP